MLAQPQARATTSATATASRPPCVVPGPRYAVGAGPRNVQHNLELQQRRACGHRVGALTGVRLDGGTGRPCLERLFGLPLRDHEVAVFALDRAQQLEAEETGLVVDGMCTVREPLLQLRTGVGRDLDCVDLHHGHVVRLPCAADGPRPADASRRRGRSAGPGARADGAGQHLVASAAVADAARRGVHLRRAVAPRPRRRRPVSDQHRAVRVRSRRRGRRAGPAGRHGRPFDGRAAFVVSGRFAARPCQRAGGRGHGAGLPRPHHRAVGAVAARAAGRIRIRPNRFTTSSGRWPGQYFLEAFDRTATGWRLHGHTGRWIEIAAEWGTRDYWKQWRAVRVPALLLEAGNSVTPAGADAQDGGNRLPDNVSARARRRSSDPRRRSRRNTRMRSSRS